ncbi:fibroblast growth factor branchless [Lycorma delicatula]|uniref:fibroblast growth factor branchless n=1 Tax=Lycorma delicatula TaxID=130591 RepID=UPI003F5108DE
MRGLARRLLLVASIGLLVVGNPLPEAMVPGPLLLQGASASADDQSARSERSANLSHITGTARKIRMYIKNRYLQLMPDGQVNGTNDQLSDYTILQRSSISAGQVKIQGVATCMHLCMDACGLLYGSREFQDECKFNEMIEEHNYNTYSSAKYSNQRRTQYLALNRIGQPRKVLIRAGTPLGKLSTYTRVLTQPVPAPANNADRTPRTCPPPPPPGSVPESPRCKKKRKKKKRRKCSEKNRRPCKLLEDNLSNEDDGSGEEAHKKTVIIRRKCEEENCRTKKLHMIGRKRKSRHREQQGTGSIGQHHDGQHQHRHSVKRTRHLHHLRHRGLPDDVEQEDDGFDRDNEDNEDAEDLNGVQSTTVDPNNEDDELATDRTIQLLDDNDKK